MGIKSSIVADNASLVGPNCNVPVTSQGNNLESTSACGFVALGDVVNANALLGPLANNGGSTLTHAPQPGSPAIDAGAAVGCPASDQRSFSRPLDGNGDGTAVCDIGAVETPPMGPVVCTPRPPVGVRAVKTDDGRLRVTLTANNANNYIARVLVTRNDNGVMNPLAPILGGSQTELFVSRVTPGGPTTIALTVTDRCGDWKTFVGGGPSGF
jgi:hypothetical protein